MTTPVRRLGPQFKEVKVLDVDFQAGWAIGRDALGKEHEVTTNWQRVGIDPKPGEHWIIDNALGCWTFAARVRPIEEVQAMTQGP